MEAEGGEQAGKSTENRWKRLAQAIEGKKETRECLTVPYEFVEITGDAVLASKLGRGRETVQTIDVYGTTDREGDFDGLEEEVRLESWNELKPILTGEQYRFLKKWVKKNQYDRLPIRFYPTKDYGKRRDACPYECEQSGLSLTVGGKSEYLFLGELPDDGNPIVLTPRETLKDALGCFEVGKRWNVPVDADVMDQAERDVRSGAVCLVDKPVKRYSLWGRVLNTNIDSETAGRLMAETEEVADRYPKLHELCRKITEEGGVEKYMITHFGKVYLSQEDDYYRSTLTPVPRGHVRLYYPDLSKSTKSEEEQRKALVTAYENTEPVNFKFVGIETTTKKSPEPMPVSETVKTLIDNGQLEEALRVREPGESPICGEYEAVYLSRRNETEDVIRQKMNPILQVLDINPERFWNSGSPKLSRKLARVLDTRNPIFANFDYSHEQGGRARVVISQNPTDILQASTEKPWTSCVNLDGGANRHSLYLDVAAGNAIAYIFDEGKPAGRMLVRFTENESGQDGAALERYYGDARFEDILRSTVKQVAEKEGLEVGMKGVTKKRMPRMYTDMGYRSRKGLIYYGYTAEEVAEQEAKYGWRSRLTEGLRNILRGKRMAPAEATGE